MNLERLSVRLAIEEGESLTAYLDTVGILTVGIGHNCVSKPVPGVEKPGDSITQEQSYTLFVEDVKDACIQLDKALPWWKSLDDARQNVMIDMCFNMGIKTLCSFHNTLAAIEEARWDDAATGMSQSKWAKQVGKRAVFLENAMRTGIY